jgi:hypothetical protein
LCLHCAKFKLDYPLYLDVNTVIIFNWGSNLIYTHLLGLLIILSNHACPYHTGIAWHGMHAHIMGHNPLTVPGLLSLPTAQFSCVSSLHCTALHCTALHCTAEPAPLPSSPMWAPCWRWAWEGPASSATASPSSSSQGGSSSIFIFKFLFFIIIFKLYSIVCLDICFDYYLIYFSLVWILVFTRTSPWPSVSWHLRDIFKYI